MRDTRRTHRHVRTLLTCGIVLAAACGGDAASSSDARPQGASAGDAARTSFTAADLAAYQRGLAREIELVKAAKTAADTASTPEARGAAYQAQFETSTIAEGAVASALGDRYAAIRQVVHQTLRTLDMQGKIDGPVSIDTVRATPEMKAQLARDPIADLPAEAAAALRAQLDALAKQWGEYVRLTAVGG